MLKVVALSTAAVVVVACVFSWVWQVPYIFTLMGFAALVVGGHFVTLDDDLPGGWSNPDSLEPFPWHALAVKLAVLIALGSVALFSPTVRLIGGTL